MEIVLHLGSHKTATTFLQETLAANQHVLDSHQIAFVPPSIYRPMVLGATSRYRVFNRLSMIRRVRKKRSVAALIETAERAGKRRLVLSEEILIGTLDKILLGTWFYDRCREELHDVMAAFDGRPVKMLFAVRRYAEYFPSAYAQALKAGTFVPFDDGLKLRLLRQTRGWPEVVADIADILPGGSELVIWQYEAMVLHQRQVLEQFVGSQAAGALIPTDRRPMQGASSRAIARLENINKTEGSPNQRRIRQVMRFNRREKGFKPFNPWSEGERRLLEARYDHDLDRLLHRWPEAFVHMPITGDTPAPRSFSPASACNPHRAPSEDIGDSSGHVRSCGADG